MKALVLVGTACLATLLLIGCQTTSEAIPQGIDMEEELFAMDREYCAAVQERGAEAWAEYYAEDGAHVSLGIEIARGPKEVFERDAPMFADPAIRLTWEPKEAHAYSCGMQGLTTGRFRVTHTASGGAETELATGHYVTVWRRQNGSWKVILDTGAPDLPPAE